MIQNGFLQMRYTLNPIPLNLSPLNYWGENMDTIIPHFPINLNRRWLRFDEFRSLIALTDAGIAFVFSLLKIN